MITHKIQKIISSSFILVIGLVFILLSPVNSAFGQTPSQLLLSTPDIDSFPEIIIDFEVFDHEGKFIKDLQAKDVIISEDGETKPVKEIFQVEPGLQIIFAINNSPFLQKQFDGVSHFARIQETLISWASKQLPEMKGDLSLASNTGLQIVRQNTPTLWGDAIEAYQPDLADEQPGISSLSHALDLATDPNPDERMKRAVLYITPPPKADTLEAFSNLAERAAQLNVKVFVWLVAPMVPAETNGSDTLMQLSTATGGEFFLFSGQEDFPDLEVYFDRMRYLYQVSYDSAVNKSGRHELELTALRGGIQPVSSKTEFEIQISPPNPIFMNPPVQVSRTWVDDEELFLEPRGIPLELWIEFPDGYERNIKTSRLFVDDELVFEKNQAPFDQFLWSIEEINQSGVRQIRVEVEDGLGLKGSTIDTQVEILVEEIEKIWWQKLLSGNQLIVIISLSVAAGVLALVLMGRRLLSVRVQTRDRQRVSDPVTQPVPIVQERRKPVVSPSSPTIPRTKLNVSAPARLVYLSEDGQQLQDFIPLHRIESTLGNDPDQAIHVLDSSSVDGLHARIHQTEKGQFVLADANSTAGTWVNYTPISPSGMALEHGDLIQIGRVSFRFEIDRTYDGNLRKSGE
ncbi:MAG: FHA domain-containing protein [Anaerolineaceae bacterium]|nr:FHA domain-containing protein [Anaerolineaceae bacterium]